MNWHCFCSPWKVIKLITLALSVYAGSTNAAELGKRLALVIGNSSYKFVSLPNATNDSADMSAKLRQLGFDVVYRENLTISKIGSTLREFRSKLTPGSTALVFYAGHGLQIKGENYLPTVDADIASEDDVPFQSISLKHILDLLDESKTLVNLVFLDACRNNPFSRGFRSLTSGLAKTNAPSGTMVSYATRPGSVASDGVGRNGIYTEHLLNEMNSNLPIEQVLKRVLSAVKLNSNGKQEPWSEGSLEGEFCFLGCKNNEAGIMEVPKNEADRLANEKAEKEKLESLRREEDLRRLALEKRVNDQLQGLAEEREAFDRIKAKELAESRIKAEQATENKPQQDSSHRRFVPNF